MNRIEDCDEYELLLLAITQNMYQNPNHVRYAIEKVSEKLQEHQIYTAVIIELFLEKVDHKLPLDVADALDKLKRVGVSRLGQSRSRDDEGNAYTDLTIRVEGYLTSELFYHAVNLIVSYLTKGKK